MPESDPEAKPAAAPDGAREPRSEPAPPPAPPRGTPVLPQRSQDETDAGWGERPEPDDEERLRQDRPPHWDQP